jgi:hypothetical protein
LQLLCNSGIECDALAQSFLDSGTVNEQEGWVQGFDPTVLQNAQLDAQQKLQDYITNNMTDPKVGDVIGGRRTIVQEYPVLPSGLPNRVVVTGKRYAELPNALRNTMTFAFGKDYLGYLEDPVSFPWATVNNARITLSFKPATADDEAALLALLPEGDITDLSQLPSSIPSYLISVIPQLKVNGEVVKSGNAMRLGDELDLIYQVKTPLEAMAPYTYKVIAGSYLALASIGEGVGSQKLKDLQNRLNDTKSKLESQDQAQIASLTREDILGDMFHAGVLGYFAEYSAMSHIMALQQRVGHNLAIGYGSYGYEPKVNYFFGIPRAIEPGGVVMNVRLGDYVATQGNDNDKRIQFREQIGMLSSSLESAIPEQMFVTPDNPGEAISAVKALAKANQQGQKIYHITQQNMATVLPNIHHDPLVMDEIKAALAVGKEVTTHSDDVSVPGWTGAGYIIMDPDTGIGAYKIGGGENGAYMIVAGVAVTAIAISIIMFAIGGAPLGVFAAIGLANIIGALFTAGISLVLAGMALLNHNYEACGEYLSVTWAALGYLAGAGIPGLNGLFGAITSSYVMANVTTNACRPR